MAAASPRYQCPEVVLLRAGTDPGGLDLPRDLDLSAADLANDGARWLSHLWQREEIRAALHDASPSLALAITQLTAAEQPDRATVRRAVVSTASYLLRWHGRSTPFGRFAGVGAAHVGGEPKVRWGNEHMVHSRIDSGWLASVVRRLHAVPDLRDRLHIVVNNAATLRGGRLVAPGVASPGGTSPAPLEVSVRATGPIRAVLEIAARPIPYEELRAKLAHRFPVDDQRRIDLVLEPLLHQRLLISNLWAPGTCRDPLGHLCDILASVKAGTISEISEMVHELQALRTELSQARTIYGLSQGVEHLPSISSLASGQLLASDTVLDGDVQIPKQLAQDAADAARLLLRLSPHAVGDPSWRDYHARFRARYGTNAVVPVLELVADSGLGYPAGYLGAAGDRPQPTVQQRERILAPLIQRAIVDGSGEVVLTKNLIDALSNGELRDMQLPARVEIAVEVHARSIDDVRSGRFTLAVTGAPRPGSSMIGRFVHLLPADDRAPLEESFASTNDNAVAVQLSFPPRRERNENISRTARLLPHVLPLSEHALSDQNLIALADVAITTTGASFDVIDVSSGRRIEPRVLHALQSTTQMPALARFLSEVTTARCPQYGAFSLGLSDVLDYVPRIRYHRTILSPAKWRLERTRMPERTAPNGDWSAALATWRRAWHVPRHVALLEHDRRQPLDLDHPFHQQLLRERLDGTHAVRLQESAAPAQLGWIGRAHELVLPLTLNSQVVSTSSRTRPNPRPQRLATPPDTAFPGDSTVVCAQLYGHPDRFDSILTEHLPTALKACATLGHAPLWWFRRHRDVHRPDAARYIALYLRIAGPEEFAAVAAVLGQWGRRLRHERLLADLTLGTYEPHTPRWGTDASLDAAQTVFAADSVAALAQISMTLHDGVDATALCAASIADMATGVADAPLAGTTWLKDELPRTSGRIAPDLRDLVWQLHAAAQAGLAPIPADSAIGRAWRSRADALASYRATLSPRRVPTEVLHDLLRLHHVRAIGPDPDRELLIRRLARSCALRPSATGRC